MNPKNERIKKLARQGRTPEQIARALGLPTTERVHEGLAWLKANHELPAEPTAEVA